MTLSIPTTAPHHPARVTGPRAWLARVAFGVAALLSFGGNGLSFHIGSWKDSDLPPNAGYAGVLEAGWEHMVNQPAYFTFLSSFLVGLTSLLLAINPHRTSTVFHALRIAGVVCIVITGVVFNILLRGEETLVGIELVNDTLQHIITPILTPLLWIVFGPRGQVSWRAIGLSMVLPLGWLGFTLARGPWLDWYPYSILDVPRMGYGGVSVYIGSILAFFVVLAALMWCADRLLDRAGVGLFSRGRAARS